MRPIWNFFLDSCHEHVFLMSCIIAVVFGAVTGAACYGVTVGVLTLFKRRQK